MTDPVIALLDKAEELIWKGWTKEELAVDKEGTSVSPEEPAAAAWCLLGALFTARQQLRDLAGVQKKAEELVQDASKTLFPDRVGHPKLGYICLNDHPLTTEADIHSIFDYARKIREQELVG